MQTAKTPIYMRFSQDLLSVRSPLAKRGLSIQINPPALFETAASSSDDVVSPEDRAAIEAFENEGGSLGPQELVS
jgi:hypothetical protein